MAKKWTKKNLMEGIDVEYEEHAHSLQHFVANQYYMRAVARQIAIDHLKEDPKYYQKLKRVGL
jgi:hypothetical protein